MRRRMWRTPFMTVVTLVLLASLIWADQQGLLLDHAGPGEAYHGKTFTVVRVVDGDTIVVAPIGLTEPTTRVRLWGVNTPEKFRPDPARPGKHLPPDPFAEQASAFTQRACKGKTVRLFVESHRVLDKYERLLAYVELPDGSVLNEELIAAGLSEAEDNWTHTHLERYELIELQARHQRVGMWERNP